MIRTWVADVKALLKKEKYLQYYKKVPDFRKEKADKIIYQEGKALSIGVWILYEQMCERYAVSENAVYNLSHSGNYALCSLDDGEKKDMQIGCDIEEIKQARMDVACRFFCEKEVLAIESRKNNRERAEAFYRYWVLKESFMKATRLGMKLGMNMFELGMDENEAPYLLMQPEEFIDTYYFKEYSVEGIPYKIAVCSNYNDISDDIKKIIL